jgi:hypothetical protein
MGTILTKRDCSVEGKNSQPARLISSIPIPHIPSSAVVAIKKTNNFLGICLHFQQDSVPFSEGNYFRMRGK